VARVNAYLRAKFHLDPSNRLTTIHQRHRQSDRQADRTGQTTVRWDRANRFTGRFSQRKRVIVLLCLDVYKCKHCLITELAPLLDKDEDEIFVILLLETLKNRPTPKRAIQNMENFVTIDCAKMCTARSAIGYHTTFPSLPARCLSMDRFQDELAAST